MGIQVESKREWQPAATADRKAFRALVRYAKTVDDKDPPTYFYSPVLGRVEAVHYSGRKTFSTFIPPSLFQQWVEDQLIQVLGQSREQSWSTGSTTSLVAFVLQEEALINPAVASPEPIFGSLSGWMRRVFPIGWRCPLDPQDADPALRKVISH